jgi:hypothetical protein
MARTSPSKVAQAPSPAAKTERRKRPRPSAALPATPSRHALKARRKFLRAFPGGFRDQTYLDWERDYKWNAHRRWRDVLSEATFRRLIQQRQFQQIASLAIGIESRTNLLFSFEKMALRDAVKPDQGARAFAEGLFALLYGREDPAAAFDRWSAVVADLPRRQTRVLTWPVTTVFGFLARPDRHFFLKPNVTRKAAEKYGSGFDYRSRPNAVTYESLLALARTVRKDLRDLRPRDMIDVQSFLWVQGSDEYED